MTREELNRLAMDYWQLLLEQQAVLKNIASVGDNYSKKIAKGILNGTLKIVTDGNELDFKLQEEEYSSKESLDL